jgi:similar to stage IV sporulation protein
MKLSINGFKLIRPIARKTKCKVRLLKKVGLPFILNRYRRRKAFFAGAILFAILIYAMTSFIWSVEIKGNKTLQTSRLETALAGNGISTGILKYRINTERAVTRMMLENKDISWISIAVKGTKVKVELRERAQIPEIIPKNVPCDIVAKKDGMIKQVIATEGVEAAGEGDTIKKGQVLISGKIPLKGEENKFRMVHAMGTVSARTWYEERVPVILTAVERLRTGKVIKDHALVLFSWKMDILHKKNKFQDYAFVEVRKKLSFGEDFVFPMEWVTKSYYEEKLVEATINEADAREAAADEAFKKVMKQLPEEAKVVKKNVKYIEDEDKGLIAEVTLECVEDIGTSKRIGGN